MKDTPLTATILVVDDRDANRYLLVKHLTASGYVVREAATAKQALETARMHLPDLIILDIRLPDFSGYEVCKQLKTDLRTQMIPVVHLSAHYESEDGGQELIEESMADGYLTQPINPVVLKATVRSFLRMSRAERELQDAIRSRDTFLSIASHELKTPLTSLSLQTQAIQRAFRLEDGTALSRERVKKTINVIDRQTKRLSQLVDDMLDVARIGGGKLDLALSEVDMSDIVNDVLEQMGMQLDTSGSNISSQIEKPISVKGDSHRLEQVVVNLLTNAAKYGAGKPVSVKLKSFGTHAVLTVSDQGIGISLDQHEKIFHRYERAVEGSVAKGLGLGLYIVQNIVTEHGGEIRVKSEPGRGSTFTVELPLYSATTHH